MPDIDVDFSDDKRDTVIQYVREKYGEDSVSQIITFGTLSSRAVLKDVGRVLGIPLSTIDSITKQIPVEQGKVRPLADALETIPELKWVKESTDPKIKTLVDASLVLEGMNRNAGMHAAGVVIAPGNISDYVPLYKTPQTEVMTQYNMKDLETAGLLKMDFLGLRTLSVHGERPAHDPARTTAWRSISTRSPRTTRRRSSSSPAATPSACSSLKAPACRTGSGS